VERGILDRLEFNYMLSTVENEREKDSHSRDSRDSIGI
jgi:hypothetical protein